MQGYRIKQYSFSDFSATRMTDRNVHLYNDGREAVVTFTLTSGPRCNRVRGWLEAAFATVQVPQ